MHGVPHSVRVSDKVSKGTVTVITDKAPVSRAEYKLSSLQVVGAEVDRDVGSDPQERRAEPPVVACDTLCAEKRHCSLHRKKGVFRISLFGEQLVSILGFTKSLT